MPDKFTPGKFLQQKIQISAIRKFDGQFFIFTVNAGYGPLILAALLRNDEFQLYWGIEDRNGM